MEPQFNAQEFDRLLTRTLTLEDAVEKAIEQTGKSVRSNGDVIECTDIIETIDPGNVSARLARIDSLALANQAEASEAEAIGLYKKSYANLVDYLSHAKPKLDVTIQYDKGSNRHRILVGVKDTVNPYDVARLVTFVSAVQDNEDQKIVENRGLSKRISEITQIKGYDMDEMKWDSNNFFVCKDTSKIFPSYIREIIPGLLDSSLFDSCLRNEDISKIGSYLKGLENTGLITVEITYKGIETPESTIQQPIRLSRVERVVYLMHSISTALGIHH